MFLINLDILPLLKPVISSFRQTEPLPGFALSLRFFARARRKVHLKRNKSSPDDTGKETAALRKQHFQKAGALTE